MRAVIFGNGEIQNYNYIKSLLVDSDTIICCDGGVRHTIKLGILPSFIVGDFDSSPIDTINYYKNLNVTCISFPVEKDFTDMELCIDFVSKRNEKELLIFGGLGSRFDHSIANIHILKIALEKNIKAKLINENNIIQLIDKEITITGNEKDTISLIPLTTEVSGVTTSGLYYPLINEILYVGNSRGISNTMTKTSAKIVIKDGLLIVIKTFDV